MSNLSDTFKYISHFRHAGHQVGRKVGDMLEVLTYAAIARDTEMLSRLQVEPKLYGFSGAGHKVEFILLSSQSFDTQNEPKVINGGSITDPSEVISFIECKKVGVEQTVNSKFKKAFPQNGNHKNYLIPYDHEFTISFAPRGGQKHTYKIRFNPEKSVSISKTEDSNFSFHSDLDDDSRIIFTLSDGSTSSIISNDGSLRDYEPTLKNCRILEIISANDNGVLALLNDCLAGPQTPEKAKQSSFVALDVRKSRFNSFDKRSPETDMVSVLVITEFSHWEEKSQNIIQSCIDKIFVVSDQIIIEAFKAFEKEFGVNFYDKITKDNFENNADVRKLAIDLVNHYNGKIFYDIEDNTLKEFVVNNKKFTAIS